MGECRVSVNKIKKYGLDLLDLKSSAGICRRINRRTPSRLVSPLTQRVSGRWRKHGKEVLYGGEKEEGQRSLLSGQASW